MSWMREQEAWADDQAAEFRLLHTTMIDYWTEREDFGNVALVTARLDYYNNHAEDYRYLMCDHAWSNLDEDMEEEKILIAVN